MIGKRKKVTLEEMDDNPEIEQLGDERHSGQRNW